MTLNVSSGPDRKSQPGCTLSIHIARPDATFLSETVAHVARACAYAFAERVLILDTAPLGSRYRGVPGVCTLEQLRKLAQRLIDDGVVDRVAEVDYSPELIASNLTHYLGAERWETHDYRGAPIYLFMFALEDAKTDYIVHFDSDVLLYQAPDYDWITRSMELMDADPRVLFSAPLPGPPADNRQLKQRGVAYHHDPAYSAYYFKTFTARKFLVNRQRLQALLPLEPQFVSRKQQWLSQVTKRSSMMGWEEMMSAALASSTYYQADLDSPRAWTLHAPEHGPELVAALPNIITRVERGEFPAAQAGDYDLQLEHW